MSQRNKTNFSSLAEIYSDSFTDGRSMRPPCQAACPIHQDVRRYISFIAQGEFDQALKVIRETNPLPFICGMVCVPHCEISLKESEEQIPTRDKVLILHYLSLAKGTPLTGKLITYKQVPGGTPYFARFSQLAVEPLLSHFGDNPELLIPAAQRLGAKKTTRGDAAVVINAFSRVPVTIVLQAGDEEFPPTASIMFDSTIPDYLPSEDIRILCEIIDWKLSRSAPNRA